MGDGFKTASGKTIEVSEEALQKARNLFEQLDDVASCSNFSDSSPVQFSAASGRDCKRISSNFRSPLIKNRRLDNALNSNDFKSPVRKRSSLAGPSTPTAAAATTTPTKSTVCGEIGNITPIKLLTPYCKNWRLCIKVTSVEELRRFRGQHVYSFFGVDESGVEIRLSAFDDIACKIAAVIRPEQMYYIMHASVKMINKRYSRSQHDMEVLLRSDSEVTECTDRPYILSPKISFQFVHIQNLLNFITEEIDVLGVVIDVGELKQLNSRRGEELQKRDIQIVDSSGYCVTVSLWGQKAKVFSDDRNNHVLAFKGLFVRSFQGVLSLVSMTSSKLLLDPEIPEAAALRDWYTKNKCKTYKQATTNQVLSFNEHIWIGQLNSMREVHVFNVTALAFSISTENAVYKGCPSCKKKLLIEKDGDSYMCPKCGFFNEYKYYYSLHMELADFTGTIRVSVFDNCAQKLIGEEADEVAKFLSFDSERYESYFKNVLFKPYIFRLNGRKRASTDNHSTSSVLVKPTAHYWSVIDLAPVPFDSYCTFLQRSVELTNGNLSVS